MIFVDRNTFFNTSFTDRIFAKSGGSVPGFCPVGVLTAGSVSPVAHSPSRRRHAGVGLHGLAAARVARGDGAHTRGLPPDTASGFPTSDDYGVCRQRKDDDEFFHRKSCLFGFVLFSMLVVDERGKFVTFKIQIRLSKVYATN